MPINNNKSKLRNSYRELRGKAKSSDRDEDIYRLLCESDIFLRCDAVFAYYSVKTEVDTVRIIEKAIADGKRVALPKCTDRNGNMEFYFIEDTVSSLADGFFSLKEPDASVCEYAVPNEKSLILVPGLAFDRRGYRLGYGGGYYDRYLGRYDVPTVGLCYEECLCERLPFDKNDIKVDFIITDKKIYKAK